MDTFRERVAIELFKDFCCKKANREQCVIKAWRSAIMLDTYRLAALGTIEEFDDFVDRRKAVSKVYASIEPEPMESYRGFREVADELNRHKEAV